MKKLPIALDLSKCGGTCRSDCQHYKIGVPCEANQIYEKAPENPDFVGVVCLVLPTGETLWFEQRKGQAYLQAVLDKWKGEHPEITEPCTVAAAIITMPRDKFIAIGACAGPGCFEWP